MQRKEEGGGKGPKKGGGAKEQARTTSKKNIRQSRTRRWVGGKKTREQQRKLKPGFEGGGELNLNIKKMQMDQRSGANSKSKGATKGKGKIGGWLKSNRKPPNHRRGKKTELHRGKEIGEEKAHARNGVGLT